VNGAVVVFTNVKVPSVAWPGSLPLPPVVCRITLPPKRRLWRPRTHEAVSANCTWWPKISAARDSPIVNGTDPARV
jgi:hypothetical protein